MKMAATAAPKNVTLDGIAGQGTGNAFLGSQWDEMTYSSYAVSANGRLLYLGRANSRDPQMRNLVVVSLDGSGRVTGVPRGSVSDQAKWLAPVGLPTGRSALASLSQA
jgi:hypothetical protein